MKKPTKYNLICYILKFYGPLTREEIMRRVFVLEGKTGKFSITSCNSYFEPATPENYTPYGRNQSLYTKGLIKRVGTKNRCHLFDLTPEGMKYAQAYEDWRNCH